MTLPILAKQTNRALVDWLYPAPGGQRGRPPAGLLMNVSAAAADSTAVAREFLAECKADVQPGQSRVAEFWDHIDVLQEQAKAFQEGRLRPELWAQELDEYAAAVTWT